MAFNAIQAGKAFIEFVIGDKKLDGQLARIGSKLRKVGSWGAAATGPLIAGFTAAALTFASAGSELNDLSSRTGVAASNLSELAFGAKLADTDLGTVEKAMRQLQDKGIDPLQFDQVAADIAAIEDPTKRADAAMTLFGKKTGTALLPLMSQLPELRQRARDLGVTLSDEDAAAADELGDNLDIAKLQLQAMAIQIGAAIAGPLTEFLTWSQSVLGATIAWIKENPRLVRTIAAVTLGIAAASAAAVTFGVILAVISAHPIIAALTVIAGLVLGVAAYFGLASDAAGDFKSSLNGVKMPGAAPNAGLTAQSQAVQTQLSSALAGRAVAPIAASAGSRGAPKPARDVGPEIVRWTRETAQGLQALIRAVKDGGLLAGTA